MAEADPKEEDRGPTAQTLDLAAFVTDARTLQEKLRVFSFLWIAAEYVLSWKSPWISALALVLAEVICTWPTLLPFLVLMAVCTLFGQTFLPFHAEKGVSSQYPSAQVYMNAQVYTVNEDDAALARQDAAARRRTEILQQYRMNIVVIHSYMVGAREFMEHIDRLVTWEVKAVTRRWLLGLVLLLSAMIILSWQLICGVAIALLFFYNRGFFALWERKSAVTPKTVSSPTPSVDDDTSTTPESDDNFMNGRRSPTEQTDGGLPSDTEDGGDEASAGTQITAGGGKPGVVSRLKALRQRRKISKECLCAGCLVSLAGILRKRCYCRHCGQDFCANCCHKDVPRALLGATAPAAKTETVLVCNTCHDFLTADSQANQRVRARATQSAASGSVTSSATHGTTANS